MLVNVLRGTSFARAQRVKVEGRRLLNLPRGCTVGPPVKGDYHNDNDRKIRIRGRGNYNKEYRNDLQRRETGGEIYTIDFRARRRSVRLQAPRPAPAAVFGRSIAVAMSRRRR